MYVKLSGGVFHYNILKYAFVSILIFALLIFASCPHNTDLPQNPENTPEIESVVIKTNPTKTSYTVGDSFEPDGLVVTISYSDGTESDVAYDDSHDLFTFLNNETNAAGQKSVVVYYINGQTQIYVGYFTITVTAAQSTTSTQEPETPNGGGTGGQTDPNGGNGGQQTQISNVVVFVNENGQSAENGQYVDVMATYDAIRTQISQGKTQGVDYLVDYGDANNFYFDMPNDLMADSRFNAVCDATTFYNEGEAFYEGNGGDHDADEYKNEASLIPGVKLVTNYADRAQDFEGAVIQRALIFENSNENGGRDIIVKMSNGNYNLNNAYKGGIIKGNNNLTIDNLNNTAISGTLYKKDDVKNFYDTFIKDKNASNLPQSLDLEFIFYNYSGYEYNENINLLNLAGSNIDKIFGTWYKYRDSGNFSRSAIPTLLFDAKDLCSEDMYNAQTGHFNDAYPVDINAALVISQITDNGVKNVLVNGDLKIDNGTVKGDNIRFAVDSMNGKSYKYQRSTAGNPGIVDFSNANVPSEVKFGLDSGSKVIFDSLNSDVYLSKIGSAQVGEFILKHLEGESHLKRGNEGAIQVVNYTNLTNIGDDKAVYGATTGNSWSNYFYWKRGTGVELNADDHRINNGNDHSAALISKVMPKESKKDLNPKQINMLLGGKEYC